MSLISIARFQVVIATLMAWTLYGTCIAGVSEQFEVTNGNDAGPGSLRAAVALANASDADNRIIQIVPAVQLIQLTTGSVELTEPATYLINGVLASQTTIDAGGTSRIFSVQSPGVNLTLGSLILRGGRTVQSASTTATCLPGSGRGGAVCTLGPLTLVNVGLFDNRTSGSDAHGGAVYAGGGVIFAATCSGLGPWCAFADNSADGAGASGGAIFSEVELLFPEMNSPTNYRFADNTADNGAGGAVRAPAVQVSRLRPAVMGDPVEFVGNRADIGGALALDCIASPEAVSAIRDVVFEANIALRGGGAIGSIRQCRLEVEASRFIENQCLGGGGGAISTDHVAEIRQTWFEGNSCDGPGGAMAGADIRLQDANRLTGNATFGDSNHGGAVAAAVLTMTGTTVDRNKTNGRAANGGGLWVVETLEIGNSTISGNAAQGANAGGGGLFFSGQGLDLDLWSSTVYQNEATRGGGGVLIAGDPVGSLVEFDIISTILARNQPDSFLLEDLGATSVVNVIQSVFGDSSSEIIGSDAGTLFSNAPGVDDLHDNGCARPAGTTSDASCPLTHGSSASSLGVDAGNNPGGYASDQRGFGFPRTFGLQTDIGAVEWNPPPSLRTVPSSIDFGTVIDGAPLPPPMAFDIVNDGPGTLFLEGLSTTPGLRRDFADCMAASPLEAGASCRASVEILQLQFGAFKGTVEIESNDPQSPELLPVSYFGTTGAEIFVSPGEIDFGDLAPGATSAAQVIVVSNTGSESLLLESISTAGGPFAVVGSNCGDELAPGAVCQIDVEFAPDASGVFFDALTIVSNSNVPNSVTEIALSGTSGILFMDGFEA